MTEQKCQPCQTQPVPWRDLEAKAVELRHLERCVGLLERRLPYLRGRADHTEHIADSLARILGFGEQHMVVLRLAARFHDLGLLGIPDTILHAPRELSPDERQVVEGHVRMGGHLLDVAFYDYPEVLEMVWFHHERPDGTGPLKLEGEQVPPLARVLSVAGAIEAMTNSRPHREALTRGQIVKELRRCAGSQYDADIVDLACQNLKRLLGGIRSGQTTVNAPPLEDVAPPPQVATR